MSRNTVTPSPPPLKVEGGVHEAYLANYDRIAADHVDHWKRTGTNPFMSPESVAAFNANTVTLLRKWVPAGAKVLDAGCAMGDVLNACPEYDRHGIDLAAEYLAIAQERGIAVTQGEVEAMPYPNASFDAVLALDILEHVLDLNAALREMFRVLKPGGVLIARSPNAEDLSGYVHFTVYDFVHLRRFDAPSFQLLFERVFRCQSLEYPVVGTELHAVVRKSPEWMTPELMEHYRRDDARRSE